METTLEINNTQLIYHHNVEKFHYYSYFPIFCLSLLILSYIIGYYCTLKSKKRIFSSFENKLFKKFIRPVSKWLTRISFVLNILDFLIYLVLAILIEKRANSPYLHMVHKLIYRDNIANYTENTQYAHIFIFFILKFIFSSLLIFVSKRSEKRNIVHETIKKSKFT